MVIFFSNHPTVSRLCQWDESSSELLVVVGMCIADDIDRSKQYWVENWVHFSNWMKKFAKVLLQMIDENTQFASATLFKLKRPP